LKISNQSEAAKKTFLDYASQLILMDLASNQKSKSKKLPRFAMGKMQKKKVKDVSSKTPVSSILIY